jgi:hypothetical protein
MALTAIERKVLECARKALKDVKETYICHAIERANLEGVKRADLRCAKDRLRGYVMRRLGDNATLSGWQADKYGGRWMREHVTRKARIAWITWMLGEENQIDQDTRREFAIYMHPERALHSYDRSGHKVA